MPSLDVGCSVGRTAFALAERSGGMALGIDLNFAMLRLASSVLRTGKVRYPRRRVGIVYDRREFAAHFPQSENVDFWACDALALPFAEPRFGLIAAINVLDCVPSPRDLLASIAGVIQPGGAALLTTPYDWAASATPVEAWLGGHSQRGPHAGASEPMLRALLTPGGIRRRSWDWNSPRRPTHCRGTSACTSAAQSLRAAGSNECRALAPRVPVRSRSEPSTWFPNALTRSTP